MNNKTAIVEITVVAILYARNVPAGDGLTLNDGTCTTKKTNQPNAIHANQVRCRLIF